MTNVLDHHGVFRNFSSLPRWVGLLIGLALLLVGPESQARSQPSLKQRLWSEGYSYLSTLWPGGISASPQGHDLSAAERKQVLGELKAHTRPTYDLLLEQVSQVRAQPLPFYTDAVLYEGRIDHAVDSPNRFTFIRHPQGFTVLTGQAKPIHALNATLPLHLDTAARVKAYLRFFCGALQGSQGETFLIVEQPEDLPWTATADETLRQAVAQELKPLVLRERDSGGWEALGTVVYLKKLYLVNFEVLPNGEVKMLTDDQKTGELPLQSPLLVKAVQS